MARASVTISIDLELAWGVWDKVSAKDLRHAEEADRPIVTALLALWSPQGPGTELEAATLSLSFADSDLDFSL